MLEYIKQGFSVLLGVGSIALVVMIFKKFRECERLDAEIEAGKKKEEIRDELKKVDDTVDNTDIAALIAEDNKRFGTKL